MTGVQTCALPILLSKMPQEEDIAIIFFDKREAEMHADKDITNAQWSRIVNKWQQNKTLNQIADELFSDAVWAITGERDKDEN